MASGRLETAVHCGRDTKPNNIVQNREARTLGHMLTRPGPNLPTRPHRPRITIRPARRAPPARPIWANPTEAPHRIAMLMTLERGGFPKQIKLRTSCGKVAFWPRPRVAIKLSKSCTRLACHATFTQLMGCLETQLSGHFCVTLLIPGTGPSPAPPTSHTEAKTNTKVPWVFGPTLDMTIPKGWPLESNRAATGTSESGTRAAVGHRVPGRLSGV